MLPENIDYDALKKRGFLRQKKDGEFVLRTRMTRVVYTCEDLGEISRIAKKYGRGYVHATTRQGLEIPFIKYDDIPEVEKLLKAAKIEVGTSGPRMRTTTCCPGNNWCKAGMVDTFALYEKIEKDLHLVCGDDMPHKFKMAISGCPNKCTRCEGSEIGIHAQVDLASAEKKIGYALYVGGKGGRSPALGVKLDKVFSESELFEVIRRIVSFYKKYAKPKQRLGTVIDAVGKEGFLKEIF